MKRTTLRAGWVVAILALATVACTCGLVQGLGQAQEGLQTAQALGTQAQQFATQAEALATQIEQSGLAETAQALATQSGSGDLQQTAEAMATAGLGSAPEDIPLMEDRQNLVSTGQAVTYNTPSDSKTVIEFYKQEMVAQGWAQASDPVEFAGMATLAYSKDNRQVQIVIAGAGGQTSVAITITP